MPDDLDVALRRLAERPDDPRLSGIEAGVLAAVHAAQSARPPALGMTAVLVLVGAAALGVAGAGRTAPSAPAALALVNPAVPYAPSTLLADAP